MKRKGKAKKYRDYKRQSEGGDSAAFDIVECPECGTAIVVLSRGVVWKTEFGNQTIKYAASDFVNSPSTSKRRSYCFNEYTKATAEVDGELIEHPEPHGHYVTVRYVTNNKVPEDYNSNRSSSSNGFLGLF